MTGHRRSEQPWDPEPPTEPESPLVSRRTLLRLGAALSVAVGVGGGLETVLHTMAGPAEGRLISTTKGDLQTMKALKAGPDNTPETQTTERSVQSATPTTLPRTTATQAAKRPVKAGSGSTAAPVKFFGPSADRHVYITIDDGYFPDNRVIDVMRSEHLPITTFLIAEAAAEHLGFWKSFVSAGGQIQNHTYSHPDLTGLSQGNAEGQWARTNQAYRRWFGSAPVIGRPPYGAVNHAVAVAAREAGLDTMIMWSALDDGSGIETWNSGPLAPGSIILLHWTPGLYSDLLAVLKAVSEHHLVPAFLAKA